MIARPALLLLQIIGALMSSVGCSASVNADADAELLFDLANHRGLAIDQPLEWSFQISGVPSERTAELIQALKAAEFADISVLADGDEDHAESLEVWFSEVRVHSVETLSERIAAVRQLLRRSGGVLEFPRVTAPDSAPQARDE